MPCLLQVVTGQLGLTVEPVVAEILAVEMIDDGGVVSRFGPGA